jgi:acyl-[acyl-carrier-protein]-phospholipid O-acyltransferase/long-chain-fatty-acid--[acyl-carrier-protein] ligase
LPGVAARIIDPVSFEPLPPNTEGLLLVKGSNRMAGYLNDPERTAAVFRDGWYVTGDTGTLDDEGFLRVTGRLSGLRKMAGGTLPEMRTEEPLGEIPSAGLRSPG